MERIFRFGEWRRAEDVTPAGSGVPSSACYRCQTGSLIGGCAIFKRVLLAVMLAMSIATGLYHPAFAVGASDPVLEGEPDYRDATRMIKSEDFRAAIPLLLRLDKSYPQNAEVLNLLGFTHRKLKDYTAAKRFYDASLAVDAYYRPALEYQGMWFIEMGDLPSARANLAKLKTLCAPCEETKDLEEALAAVKP